MRCADCGKPVHRSAMCGECDVQTYAHDKALDSMLCLGSGPHVTAEPSPSGILSRVRDGLLTPAGNSSSEGEAA